MARLDPTEGREIQKTRPCAIVSPPEIHDFLQIIIVAPLTSGSSPARYRISTNFGGRAGFVLLEQIRVLDKRRLVRRMGRLENQTLSNMLAVLREMFAE